VSPYLLARGRYPMTAKPQISTRRPGRPETGQFPPPKPITQAAVPLIDPESPDALAYTMRGRTAAPDTGMSGVANEAAGEEVGHVSVKLPPEVSRKLSAIADRRGSKRTHVALEVLEQPLRDLAAQHRAGRFPELPKIVSGTVRASVAFVLPPELATDLGCILTARRAVKAQVIVRLLVPAIENLYVREIIAS